MRYRIPQALVDRTFAQFRLCGEGERECQALWISAWQCPENILDVVHPRHRAHALGFDVDGAWLNEFWLRLADTAMGIRVQIHTHPDLAFHSPTDDAYPIIHTPGFLSLVIPNFGLGPVGFREAYLAQLGSDGSWREVHANDHLEIV